MMATRDWVGERVRKGMWLREKIGREWRRKKAGSGWERGKETGRRKDGR